MELEISEGEWGVGGQKGVHNFWLKFGGWKNLEGNYDFWKNLHQIYKYKLHLNKTNTIYTIIIHKNKSNITPYEEKYVFSRLL